MMFLEKAGTAFHPLSLAHLRRRDDAEIGKEGLQVVLAVRRFSANAIVLVVLTASSVVALLGVQPVGADTFNVTNTNDSGPGSLRQAVADASLDSVDDTVVIQPGLGTITLSSPIVHTRVVYPGSGLEIVGNGVTINAGGATSALVDSVGIKPFVVSGVTIFGIGPGGTGDVGAIVSDGGGVTVSDCTIRDNNMSTTGETNFIAPVLSVGNPVVIDNCAITNNTVSGESDSASAVLSQGDPVTITNSEISFNSVTATFTDDRHTGAAGGVFSNGHTVTFRSVELNCNAATVTGGSAHSAAGGLLSEGGDISINDSSVQGNRATATGGAAAQNQILNDGGAESISNTIVSDDQTVCQPTPTTTTSSPPSTITPTSTTTTQAGAASPVVATPRFAG